MKYSEEIKAAVKAIEHDISYFASGIRLQYPDKAFEEVKQDINGGLRSKIEAAHTRKDGDKRPTASIL